MHSLSAKTKFSIFETKSGPTSISVFREGDYFTLQVKGGALNKNDSITATYIAVSDLNDPEFYKAFEAEGVRDAVSKEILINTLIKFSGHLNLTVRSILQDSCV